MPVPIIITQLVNGIGYYLKSCMQALNLGKLLLVFVLHTRGGSKSYVQVTSQCAENQVKSRPRYKPSKSSHKLIKIRQAAPSGGI